MDDDFDKNKLIKKHNTHSTFFSDSASDTIVDLSRPLSNTNISYAPSLPPTFPQRLWLNNYSERFFEILREKQALLKNRFAPLAPIAANFHSFTLGSFGFSSKQNLEPQGSKPQADSSSQQNQNENYSTRESDQNPSELNRNSETGSKLSIQKIKDEIVPLDAFTEYPKSTDEKKPYQKSDIGTKAESEEFENIDSISFVSSILTPNSYTKSYSDTPSWMIEPFIYSGYRPVLNSYKLCLHSILKTHNETGNIWTHMIGAALVITLTLVTHFYTFPYLSQFGYLDLRSYLVLYIYLLTALTCLVTSSLFHTFICHSEDCNKLFIKCDFMGILLLIVGSFIPLFYYAYSGDTKSMVTYMTMISVLGLIGMLIILFTNIHTDSLRWLRPTLFVLISFSSLIPIVSHSLKFGYHESSLRFSLNYIYLMGLSYLTDKSICSDEKTINTSASCQQLIDKKHSFDTYIDGETMVKLYLENKNMESDIKDTLNNNFLSSECLKMMISDPDRTMNGILKLKSCGLESVDKNHSEIIETSIDRRRSLIDMMKNKKRTSNLVLFQGPKLNSLVSKGKASSKSIYQRINTYKNSLERTKSCKSMTNSKNAHISLKDTQAVGFDKSKSLLDHLSIYNIKRSFSKLKKQL
ncbi:hypothetical protein BB558_004506 [Smittium angustum]|uniref:Uncharacterized protein n=1 Tax=Smittium angustum TaxID=133377 RepID=A0A2U1J391_SMIAN|nr:hypothetical protein BB558_004506 [Smittium angustum]